MDPSMEQIINSMGENDLRKELLKLSIVLSNYEEVVIPSPSGTSEKKNKENAKEQQNEKVLAIVNGAMQPIDYDGKLKIDESLHRIAVIQLERKCKGKDQHCFSVHFSCGVDSWDEYIKKQKRKAISIKKAILNGENIYKWEKSDSGECTLALLFIKGWKVAHTIWTKVQSKDSTIMQGLKFFTRTPDALTSWRSIVLDDMHGEMIKDLLSKTEKPTPEFTNALKNAPSHSTVFESNGEDVIEYLQQDMHSRFKGQPFLHWKGEEHAKRCLMARNKCLDIKGDSAIMPYGTVAKVAFEFGVDERTLISRLLPRATRLLTFEDIAHQAELEEEYTAYEESRRGHISRRRRLEFLRKDLVAERKSKKKPKSKSKKKHEKKSSVRHLVHPKRSSTSKQKAEKYKLHKDDEKDDSWESDESGASSSEQKNEGTPECSNSEPTRRSSRMKKNKNYVEDDEIEEDAVVAAKPDRRPVYADYYKNRPNRRTSFGKTDGKLPVSATEQYLSSTGDEVVQTAQNSQGPPSLILASKIPIRVRRSKVGPALTPFSPDPHKGKSLKDSMKRALTRVKDRIVKALTPTSSPLAKKPSTDETPDTEDYDVFNPIDTDTCQDPPIPISGDDYTNKAEPESDEE